MASLVPKQGSSPTAKVRLVGDFPYLFSLFPFQCVVLKTKTVRSCFCLGPCLGSELLCLSLLLTLLPLRSLRILSILASRENWGKCMGKQGFSASLKILILALLGTVKSGSRPRGRLICRSLGCQSSGASICKIFNKVSGGICDLQFIFHTSAAMALLPLWFSLHCHLRRGSLSLVCTGLGGG